MRSKILFFLVLVFIYVGLFADKDPLWMRYPAISPDGEYIAFSYKDDIYKVPVKGGIAIQLTSHSAYDFKPVWSPDGKNIAFASDRFGNFDVFLISADGGVPKRLTYNSAGQVPNCFSKDSKNVLFSAFRSTLKRVKYTNSIFKSNSFILEWSGTGYPNSKGVQDTPSLKTVNPGN